MENIDNITLPSAIIDKVLSEVSSGRKQPLMRKR